MCCPSFRFNRTYRGLYYPHNKTVTVPRNVHSDGKRTTEVRLLHEFAHHLADERQLARGLPIDGHGNAYKSALWDAVIIYFQDATRYPWSTEYTTVRAYGERRLAR